MKNRILLIAAMLLSMGLFINSNTWAQAEYDPQGPPPPGPMSEVPPQPQGPPQGPPLGPPQGPSPQQPQPQTTVARISVAKGSVSTMRGDNGQWQGASVNTPVVPGDQVGTSDHSRAEVQLDYANIVRLEARTDLKVADLEQNKLDLQLASGTVQFSALPNTQTDAEIDTPNMGVHLLAPGVYRIQVNSPSETMLIVRQGEAEVLTDQGSVKVEAGQMAQVHGTDNPEYKIDAAPGGDDFDNWCADRDRQIQTAQSWQHTDQYYTGANDLDQYGQWQQVPDYGWCWTPQVDMGWTPYTAGYWGYEPYWGWTWISSEPWGWAPYHYGRWFVYGGRWNWWPAMGVYGARPIWAPAYVSFFGFGRGGFGVGVGFGFGSIGWLALGPRDIFHPWWGGRGFGAVGFADLHGAGYIRAGGPRFGSNLENMMNDQRVRAAVRGVSATAFGNGRLARSMPVSEGMLHSATMMRGSLPAQPNRAAMGFRSSSYAGGSSQHFFSRSGSPAARTAMAGGGNSWQHYSSNSAGRWPSSVNGPSNNARGGQYNWQRYASPSPYSGRSGANYSRGGYQGYSSPSRGYSEGGGNRGGSYGGGYGGRQPMNLNPPMMRQRAPSGGYYGGGGNYGGGRSYSAPSGHYSAPSGGGRSYSAPHSSGGGGGGYHGGGGGSHGGGGHGHR